MKFKQLCILATISMLTLTGCQSNKGENYEQKVSDLKAEINTLKEEITSLKNTEEEVTSSTDNEGSNKQYPQEEENSIIDIPEKNPNYTTNEFYFEDEYIRIGDQSYTLDQVKAINNEKENKETFNIYDHDKEEKLIKSKTTVELGKDLNLEAKLSILCDTLEKEMGDIEIMVSSTKDDKVATIIAIEKYPVWGSVMPNLRYERSFFVKSGVPVRAI